MTQNLPGEILLNFLNGEWNLAEKWKIQGTLPRSSIVAAEKTPESNPAGNRKKGHHWIVCVWSIAMTTQAQI